jgi:hypothetical protein
MKTKGTQKSKGPSLVVEAPDSRYESYWKPETMEIVETKSHALGSESLNSSNDFREQHHSEPRPRPPPGPIFKQNYPFVILDCANIGWAFGGSNFSALGVKIAYDTFDDLPINLYGFIPSSYVKRKPKDGSRGNSLMETEDWEILDQLIGSRRVSQTNQFLKITTLSFLQQLSVVPSGDSDDLYILNFAQHHDAYVISNDFYHDHLTAIDSVEEREMANNWLQHRRCSYTFTPGYEGTFTLMLNPSRLVYSLSFS